MHCSHADRLTEEISNGLHALRPPGYNQFSEHPVLKSAQSLDLSSVLSGIEDKSPSAEPAVAEISPQERLLLWPSTIDSDVSQCYNLGKLNLEPQIVVELFEQCV